MKRRPGFIALISMLILSAIGLLISVGLFTRAHGESLMNVQDDLALQARQAATACAEYGLMQLKTSNTYAGNEVRSVGGYTCKVLTPGGSGSTNRTISATSTISGVNAKVTVTVTSIDPTMSISSWTDVVDF
jgi:hypothetical protein